MAHKRPVFVSAALFAQAEDMSEYLEKINQAGGEEAD
jgi:hypothetical protein